jgi:hypothetical protein|tara:strand:+ start:7261 stop:7686 length:426 start_codon:yes stop_codon:yes gene_type:complete
MGLSRVFLVGSGVDIVIGANTVSAGTIKANTILPNNVAEGTLTADRIKGNTINSSHIAIGTVHANSITQNTINSSHIASGTILSDSLANVATPPGGLSYGGASAIPSISVNDKGQITRVANVAVSIGDGGGLNPFLLLGVG